MRKNNKIINRIVIICMTIAILITGCKKNNIESSTTYDNIIDNTETSTTIINDADIEVEEYNGPDFTKIYADKDIETFRALSLDDFILMMEHYFPIDDPDRSYKTLLKINDDTEMTTEVWIAVRDIVCKQLFGEPFNPEEEEITAVYEDENWMYIAPNAEYIESLTDDEFINWLFKLDEYNGYDYVDYNLIPKEDISMYKKAVIDELKSCEGDIK